MKFMGERHAMLVDNDTQNCSRK